MIYEIELIYFGSFRVLFMSIGLSRVRLAPMRYSMANFTTGFDSQSANCMNHMINFVFAERI